MVVLIITNFIGVMLFLFLFWKRLREDYIDQAVFSTAFYMLTGLLVGIIVSSSFYPLAWFWIVLIGVSLGLVVGIFKYKLRPLETIEASVISLLPWLGIFYFTSFLLTQKIVTLMIGVIIIFLIGLFVWLDRNYKSFSWYKSGRIGFSGLTILGVFFLIKAVVAAFVPDMLSFIGKYEIYLSAFVAFICFFVVYNLARKTT